MNSNFSEAFIPCPNCGAPIKIGATSCDQCQAGKSWDEAVIVIRDSPEPPLYVLLGIAFVVIEVPFAIFRSALESSLSREAFKSAFLLLFLGKVIVIVGLLFIYSKYRQSWMRRRAGDQSLSDH